MYSYDVLAVAAAVPTAGSVRATGPLPGLVAEVLPYEEVRQEIENPVTDATAQGRPTTVTDTFEASMPEGKPSTWSVINVPPAVEPRRGAMDVTMSVCVRW